MRKFTLVSLTVAGSAIVSPSAFAAPNPNPDGLDVGVHASITPVQIGTSEQLVVQSKTGLLSLLGGPAESAKWALDGGVNLYGQPVRVMLGSFEGSPTEGVFQIWSGTDYLSATASPLFELDSTSTTPSATFKGTDVSVLKDGTTGGNLTVGGTLTVAGKAVATQGAPSVAFGNATATGTNSFATGIFSSASGAGAFAAANGKASGSFAAALGTSAVADNSNSMAFGYSAMAHGPWSLALGYDAVASSGANYSMAMLGGTTYGQYSTALSFGVAQGANSLSAISSTAVGDFSFAVGPGVKSQSYASTALGIYGATSTGASATSFVDTDALFTLGNGLSDTQRSSAMVTLKNGQTTLRNKYWDENSPTAEVPTPVGANNGKALVVEGNTELKGKVTIARQGDISMGIYAP